MTTSPPSEVRPYLVRLVSLILLAIALMTSVAVWAWNEYGVRLADRPPLPAGTPPMGSNAPRLEPTPRLLPAAGHPQR